VKLHTAIRIYGRTYPEGSEVPWLAIYPFFLIHMLAFGGSGFLMAYGDGDVSLWYQSMFGGFAIAMYTVFYLAMFGLDEVKWMFINAALGLVGIYSQVGWILSLFDRQIGDYPVWAHVIPILYFVLYTFLIRQAVLDITRSRDDDRRRRRAEYSYVAVSLAIYVGSYCLRGL
jgi:hypothetical protein